MSAKDLDASGEKFALCLKAYYLRNAVVKGKFARKFICIISQKKQNLDSLTMDSYCLALEKRTKIIGMNVGFRIEDSR